MSTHPASDGGLLVVAESLDRTPVALSLPWQHARIVADMAEIHSEYETVAVEPDGSAPAWLKDTVEVAQHRVRAGGSLLLILPVDRLPAECDLPRLTGMAWDGVDLLDERLVVRLVPRGTAGSPADEQLAIALAAAHLAARAAYAHAERDRQAAGHVLSQHVAARRESELNLLDRLTTLAAQVEEVERRHRGTALVRTVAGRTRWARALRPAVRWLVRKPRH